MNRRLLVPLAGGVAVEAVYYTSGTLCVSAQAGCAVGCPFCASGSRGLLRNLTAAEMSAQIEAVGAAGFVPERVTISGIGEPLHNLAAVSDFLAGCRLRHLPVSLTTCGTPLPSLQKLLQLPHNGVMLSLHAATAPTRRQLVPAGDDPAQLRQFLLSAWTGLARRRRRKIGINYLLLAGINDSDAELAALGDWLRPFPELTVHLLAYNCLPELNLPFATSPRLEFWYGELSAAGVHVRRANRWRTQADGGCGTLYVRHAT